MNCAGAIGLVRPLPRAAGIPARGHSITCIKDIGN